MIKPQVKDIRGIMHYVVRQWFNGAVSYNESLSEACETQLGVSALMFKTLKNIVHLATLALAAYAIDAGVDPFLALVFAALIISGPEILEWWLINNDYREYKEQSE